MAGKSSTYKWFLQLGAKTDSSFSKATDEASKDLQKIGKSAKDSSEQFGGLSDVLDGLGLSLGSLTAAGIASGLVKGVQYMNDLVEETQELRTDLSKLEQNALDAGQEIDSLNEHLTDMVAITGESDSSIEALSNLMAAGYTGDGLQEAVDLLSAAVVKFPDTLKIESLADSLQETIATGEATGQFEELLGRLGVDTEDFADNLAACADNAERQDYALQTLASTGLSDTLEMYKQNNEELLEYNQLAFENEQAAADLAEAWVPAANGFRKAGIEFKRFLTEVLKNANESHQEGMFGINGAAQNYAEYLEAKATKTLDAFRIVTDAEEQATYYISDHEEYYNRLADTYEHRTDDIKHAVYDTETALEELEESYKAAKETALESIQAQWKGWDTVDYTVTESAATITSALNSQTTFWNTYATNLEMLEGRNIEGLDEVVQSMADGSEDSATYIAAMAWATDDELTTMVAAYEGLQESQERTSDSMAQLETDYNDSLDAMQAKMEDLTADLDQEDEAYTAARNTMKGFALGLTDSVPDIASAYASVLNAAAANITGSGASGVSMGILKAEERMASGGIVTSPTVALIGEGGESEAVLPLSKLDALLDSGTGGGAVTVNYAPQITLGAGASRSDTESALQTGFRQFQQWMSQYERQGKRLKFA